VDGGCRLRSDHGNFQLATSIPVWGEIYIMIDLLPGKRKGRLAFFNLEILMME
jgi:hypothetical protein